MATNKPDLTRVWANGAPPANVVDPDTTTPGKVNAGWQAEVPPFEHFNFLQKWSTQGLAHFNEQGIGVWDTDTTYPVDGLAKGSDGNIYISIQEQSGNDPVVDTGVNWDKYITSTSRFDTLAEAVTSTNTKRIFDGASVIIGDRENRVWDVVLVSGVTPNTYNVVACTGLPTLALVLRVGNMANVKEFGAIGDNVAVDDGPIQAAVDYMSGGGVVFFPEGDYVLTTPINIWQGQTWQGVGNKNNQLSNLRGTGAIQIIGNANETTRPQFTELKYVKLKGLAFNGFNCKATFIDNVTETTYFVEWEVADCYFGDDLDVGLDGIFLTSTIRDNAFRCSKHISSIADFDSPNIREPNGLTILRNRFDAADDVASCHVEAGYDVLFEGNIWQGNSVPPMLISGVHPCRVHGNYFEANTAPTIVKVITDTVVLNRWGIINFDGNYISQSSGFAALIELEADENKFWCDITNNTVLVPSGYLTRIGAAAVYDLAIRKSERNYFGVYSGSIKNDFERIDWSPTQGLEKSIKTNGAGQPYQFLNDGAEGVELEGILNTKGLSDRHALFSGEAINSNTSVGVKSNRAQEAFRVFANWDGASYLSEWFSVQANNGLVTAQGIYDATSASPANVFVTTGGSLLRSTSSRRFKENEAPVEIDSSWLHSVQPKTFDYLDRHTSYTDEDGNEVIETVEGDKNALGYIAEELAELDPRAATYDAEGKEDGNEWNYLLICAIEEIKKLRKELDELKGS